MTQLSFLKKPLILHFVGICGSGKSTLCNSLIQFLEFENLRVIKTLDYDINIQDKDKQNERAFNRELDLLNNKYNGKNLYVQEKIVEHCLNLIRLWENAKADILLVDRWYESYDNLFPEHIITIEQAIKNSNLDMKHIFLKVAENIESNDKKIY